MLPISRDNFRLRAPVDRRIYEIVRKHCGQQTSRRVGPELLQKKVGSKQAEKHFHAHLRNLVRSNHLPDYAVTVESGQAVLYKRAGAEGRDGKPSSRHGGKAAGGALSPVMSSVAEVNEVPAGMDRPRSIRISGDAFERARHIAPGWDRYAL